MIESTGSGRGMEKQRRCWGKARRPEARGGATGRLLPWNVRQSSGAHTQLLGSNDDGNSIDPVSDCEDNSNNDVFKGHYVVLERKFQLRIYKINIYNTG